MKKLLRVIHKGQRGIGLLGILALVALAAGGWFSWNMWAVPHFWPEVAQVETPELPDRARGYEFTAFGCTQGADGGDDLNGVRGVIITAPYTMAVDEFDWRCGRYGAGSSALVYMRLYEYSAGSCLGDLIATSEGDPISSLQPGLYPGIQPWHTFNFDPMPTIYEGNDYVFQLHHPSGANLWTDIWDNDTTCVGAILQGWTNSGSCYTGKSPHYMVRGYRSSDPEVYTIGHEINLDGSATLYGAVDNFGSMDVGFLVSDDYDAVVSGAARKYEAGNTGWTAGTQRFDYRLAYLSSDVQYSYRAYAEAYSTTWYGPVYNFTRTAAMVPLTLACDVIQNDMDGVTFASLLAGIASNSTTVYNLTIEYGVNITACQAGNGTITVATNITDDGTWRTTSTTGTDFDPGTKYYYRLLLAGNDTTIQYTTTGQFVTYDPDQPPAVNWIITHMAIEPGDFWWILAVVGLFAVWAIAAATRWPWVGVIGTAALLTVLIAYGMVNKWVVVLMILIAGWIIFKIVFHQKRTAE